MIYFAAFFEWLFLVILFVLALCFQGLCLVCLKVLDLASIKTQPDWVLFGALGSAHPLKLVENALILRVKTWTWRFVLIDSFTGFVVVFALGYFFGSQS